ncbi:universal stress protein [Ignavibacteria bacterium]|nr:universal stress protein [Bacteroidota bacterium]MCZ2131955.1 universal stress protein [Bacteroidota bacterium]
MIQFKTIVVPTDFSPHAENALGYAKELARSSSGALHLIHVIEPMVYPVDWGYAQVGFIDVEKEFVKAAERDLGTLKTSIEAEGIPVTATIAHGKASDCITSYAMDNNADVICIATHGRGGFEHFLFGSTTERVLRKAHCPVFVVKIQK